MYQKDYIMRMIEEIGTVVAALLGFREKGDSQKAMELIEKTLRSHFDTNLDQLLSVSEEDFLVEVTLITKEDSALQLIAEMLYQNGLVLIDDNGARALESMVRSLLIFYYLDAESNTYNLNWTNRIKEIDQIIKKLEN